MRVLERVWSEFAHLALGTLGIWQTQNPENSALGKRALGKLYALGKLGTQHTRDPGNMPGIVCVEFFVPSMNNVSGKGCGEGEGSGKIIDRGCR